jgi:hypothetical protein
MTFVGDFGNCAEVLALAERAEAAAATAGFISESAGFAFRHPSRQDYAAAAPQSISQREQPPLPSPEI